MEAAMTDNHEAALQAVRDSLRSVASVRDYLIAVGTGAEIATGMLDRAESRLLEALQARTCTTPQ
jgi:hypothetical protein